MKIKFLSPGAKNPNSAALIYPLIKYSRFLSEELGCRVEITASPKDAINADVTCIDSKYFKDYWGRNEEYIIDIVERAKENGEVVWFDNTDSTGCIQKRALEICDRYLKPYVLKDKSLYGKRHYGQRVFTDYYNSRVGIRDENEIWSEPIDRGLQKKIGVSWAHCWKDYSSRGPYLNKLFFLCRGTRIVAEVLRSQDRLLEKTLLLNGRMRTSGYSNCVGYQRMEMTRGTEIESKKLRRHEYIRELRRSYAAISPFGWGEINIRDWECLACSVAVIKPSIEHIDTWPSLLVSSETYLETSWDMSEAKAQIEEYLRDKSLLIEIGERGRQRYRERVLDEGAGWEFARRFSTLLKATNK